VHKHEISQAHELTNHFVSSTGAHIFYRDFQPRRPSGLVPLMCLHGFLRNSRDFSEVGELLASQGVRVIIPDLRGRGFSQRFADPANYHYDLVKRDVAELISHLKLNRLAVLGTALGAFIGMDLVVELHGSIGGLILNDQGAEVNTQSANKMASSVEQSDYSFDEAVTRMKTQFGQAHPGLSHERWVNLMHRAYREVSPGRYARDLDLATLSDVPRMKAERFDLWPFFLATKQIPVSILRGELSEYFSEDCAIRMTERHKNAVLTTVKDRGHPLLLDEPESLSAILDLLKLASPKPYTLSIDVTS
jgi:pimeloyl-ACP methyl ester carboxylesterase